MRAEHAPNVAAQIRAQGAERSLNAEKARTTELEKKVADADALRKELAATKERLAEFDATVNEERTKTLAAEDPDNTIVAGTPEAVISAIFSAGSRPSTNRVESRPGSAIRTQAVPPSLATGANNAVLRRAPSTRPRRIAVPLSQVPTCWAPTAGSTTLRPAVASEATSASGDNSTS